MNPLSVFAVASHLPEWDTVCADVDTHLHFVREEGNLTREGHVIYHHIHTLLSHVTRGDLIYVATHAKEWDCFELKHATMDILLITERHFYGTKGISLDEIAPNHYHVTELQPNGLLIFLAGLDSLTISVIGNCVVIEDNALSTGDGLTQARSGTIQP